MIGMVGVVSRCLSGDLDGISWILMVCCFC